jgi:ATP-dependent Clp protease ATP-binding subunit ClpC
MFERFTEKARRVIFFARYEAAHYGSPYIETEHLLLGVLREDKVLTNRVLGPHSVVEAIRKQIDGLSEKREKLSTSVDIPMSRECKNALAFAAEESERMNAESIETDHLLLGLLREEKSLAAQLLRERGVTADQVRDKSRKAFWTPEEP